MVHSDYLKEDSIISEEEDKEEGLDEVVVKDLEDTEEEGDQKIEK